MCSLTTIKTKQNIKDQSSSPPQTSGSFETPLRSLSVHYQSISYHRYQDVFTLAVYCCAHEHCKKQVCQQQLCQQGSSFSCYEISGGQGHICRKWHPKQWDHPHVLLVFSAVQRLYSISEGPVTSTHSPCASVARGRQISLKRKFTSKFFLFVCLFLNFFLFFAEMFQLLFSSKQVLLKDSH